MALTHITAIRDTLADALVDSLDVGSTDANGDLVIMTSGDVEVATLALSNPASGASSSGTATFSAITNDSSATGGTAALFKLQDRDNTEKVRGTVGAGSGDISLSSVSIGAGDTVSITSLTYSASA